ncbi:transposase [Streptomyces gelaticus]
MDLDDPGREVRVGSRSAYPEEFRKDPVALYRAVAGKRTYVAVTADLGITAESLRTWVGKDEARAAPEACDGRQNTAEELARLGGERPATQGRARAAAGTRDPARAAAYFAREVK